MSQFDERDVEEMAEKLWQAYQHAYSQHPVKWHSCTNPAGFRMMAHHVMALLADEREECAKVAETEFEKAIENGRRGEYLLDAIRARSKR